MGAMQGTGFARIELFVLVVPTPKIQVPDLGSLNTGNTEKSALRHLKTPSIAWRNDDFRTFFNVLSTKA
jgi:hypothetical protein